MNIYFDNHSEYLFLPPVSDPETYYTTCCEEPHQEFQPEQQVNNKLLSPSWTEKEF